MGLEDKVNNLFKAGIKLITIPLLINLGLGGSLNTVPAQMQRERAHSSHVHGQLDVPSSDDFFPLRVGNSYEYSGLEVKHVNTRLGNSGSSITIDSVDAVIKYHFLSVLQNDSSQLYTVLVETDGDSLSIRHFSFYGAPTRDDTLKTMLSRKDTMYYLDRGNEVFKVRGNDTLLMGRHTYSDTDFFTWDQHGLRGGSVVKDTVQAMNTTFEAVKHTSYTGVPSSPVGKTTDARRLLKGVGLFTDSTFVDFYPHPQAGFSTKLKYLKLVRFSPAPPDTVVTSIPLSRSVRDFALHQNYPNPFNPRTTITYRLPRESAVALKIFNLMGQEVTTLVNERQTPGVHKIDFNADKLPSGIYFYMIQTPYFAETRKMLLMR